MTSLTPPGVAARLKSARADRQARALRKVMTASEVALWRLLRQYPVAGSHWRKQAPIGPYVADFICHRARLIVELDGAVHETVEARERDAQRQTFLEGRGYRVLRFSNDEVKMDEGRVVRAILSSAQHSPPPPAPSPQGGGGEME